MLHAGQKSLSNFYRCMIVVVLLAAVMITCMIVSQSHGKQRKIIHVNDGNRSHVETSIKSYSAENDYYLFSSFG